MKREILCPNCAEYVLHPLDVQDGYRMRKVTIDVRAPADHGVTVNGAFSRMKHIHCDLCGCDIVDHSTAVCCTTWKPSREGEPGPWEEGYRA